MACYPVAQAIAVFRLTKSGVGESACVDPNNFDESIGRDVARANARDQLWKLLGFRLLDKKMELN